ncbi:MAG: T9SS type A sorting domain-containing protein, partial [Chitinophagaceae bacterium]
ERSMNGFNYNTVASITSRNSQVETNYTHSDPVGSSNAEYYYRLKMIDIDGGYKYSPVVFIRVVSKNNFSILGSFFQDFVVLKYTVAQDQKISLRVFNSAGALLRKEEYAVTAGSGIYTLYGLTNYTPGMYLLKLESGGEIQTFKVIKNK